MEQKGGVKILKRKGGWPTPDKRGRREEGGARGENSKWAPQERKEESKKEYLSPSYLGVTRKGEQTGKNVNKMEVGRVWDKGAEEV